MGKTSLGLSLGAALALCAAGCTTTTTQNGGAPASTAWHWPWQEAPYSAMPVAHGTTGSESDPTSLANKGLKPGADLYVATARMYEQSGNVDGAKQQYERALKDKPDYLPALLGYARMQDSQRQFAAADQLYERALKKHPEDAAVYNDMALSRQHRGQLEQAVQMMNRAIALQPDKPLYRNNMAAILIEMNRTDEALKQLTSAHGPAIGHYNLAILLHRKGDDGLARYHFAMAAEVDPSLVAAREWSRRLGADAAAEQVANNGMQPQQQMAAAPQYGQPLRRPVIVNAPVAGDMGAPQYPPAMPTMANTAGAASMAQDVGQGVRYPQHTVAPEADGAVAPTPERMGEGAVEVAGFRRLPPLQ